MCKNICVKHSFAYTENEDCFGVGFPIDIKSKGFQFHLDASCVSSPSKDVCYNETVSLLKERDFDKSVKLIKKLVEK